MAEPLILKNGSNITNNVTINSVFESGSSGVHTTSSVGIGTTTVTNTLTVAGVTSTSEAYVAGVCTATSGFISAASTTAVQITLSGNRLIFTGVGIGSTSFILS
jgi:hypothetical protein|tara:strand:- start:343 stop:654 length:312 start_codon:yes stop_codon:yes gene_type:complete